MYLMCAFQILTPVWPPLEYPPFLLYCFRKTFHELCLFARRHVTDRAAEKDEADQQQLHVYNNDNNFMSTKMTTTSCLQ